MLVLLSSCVALAAVGTPHLEAEPLRTNVLHGGSQPDERLHGWSQPSADTENSAVLGNVPRVASAITPLDLRKVSMSDFGDVEQGR